MRILVVGAGALGSLFAGLLSEREEVCVKTDWAEQADAIRARGIEIRGSGDGVRVAHPPVALEPAEIPWVPDVVLVCVKVYDTAARLGELVDRIGSAPVVTIQNGLAQLEIIAGVVGADRMCAAPTYQAATKLRPGVIRHSANGETVFWADGELPEGARSLSEAMERAGMPVRIGDDGRRASWEKLIVTAGLNALAAVLHVPVGGLAQSATAKQFALRAAEEARRVAELEGVVFAPEEIAEAVDRVTGKTAKNYSSMLQDVLAGRPTEVEFVNGFVAQESRRHGVAAPLNEALRDLVQSLTETTTARVR
jgi:2-dehydropantoate 2-reductase